ncbi:MAG: Peptide chain release factor 2, partial [Candidatus Woesebacteria bacterium GW2011_GWB1_38_5b]
MNDLKAKISELRERFEAFKASLNIEQNKVRIKELEAKSTDPDLWNDQQSARALMQELGDLKKELQEV